MAKTTALLQLHREQQARMTEFAGWQLPLQFAGIVAEHLHTRTAASLFDVSHMGQIQITARAETLESRFAADLLSQRNGTVSYLCLTNNTGGIVDDVLLSREAPERWLLICNAANTEKVLNQLSGGISCRLLSERAMLALQGPAAAKVAERFFPGCTKLKPMHCRWLNWQSEECLLSRTGYTGADGFEICLANSAAPELAACLLNEQEVLPAGLGARDSLRLEAGFCLHGQDIDEDITPVEASLAWTIAAARRPGGSRGGGFPGAAVIHRQLQYGTRHLRTGLHPQGRAPIRSGKLLHRGAEVGCITSGGYSPILQKPLAMGLVSTALCTPGKRLSVELRGKMHTVVTAPLRNVAASSS